MFCDDAPGVPLCRVPALAHGSPQGLYVGPVTAAELAALGEGDVYLVRDGALQALRYAQARALDPSVFLDIDGYVHEDTYDAHETVREPAMPSRLSGRSVRAVFAGSVPPASREREAFIARAGLDGAESTDAARPRERIFTPSAIAGLRDRWVGRFASGALRLWPESSSGGAPAASAVAGPHAPGVPVRAEVHTLQQRWRQWLMQVVLATSVSQRMGHQQATYLRRMLSLFERGDLDEALRHAVPVEAMARTLGQALRLPQRRDRPDLSAGLEPSPSFSPALGEQVTDHLRQTYRRAFERLDRQGRTDEAGFVLAELLNVRTEALDYLVFHRRPAQAAELALSWDLSAEIVVRLLMLAGDTARAVQVARRDDAFFPAIVVLQDEHPEHAATLRREWGLALVQRGEWLAAVDAVWPLEAARDQAMQWLIAAEAAGSGLSWRALVRRAALLPETLTRHVARIERLTDPAASPEARTAVAQELLALPPYSDATPAVKALVTAVLPALAADRAIGANGFTATQFDRLRALSGDAGLRIDLLAGHPPPSARGALWRREDPLVLAVPDAGAHKVRDVAALGGRRYLVALGEAGTWLVDEHGRTLHRYSAPAFQLAIADSREVALAIAPREAVSRVTRLDLVEHRSTDLGVMPLQHSAGRFDGIAWTVVSGNRILVVDTTSAARDVLWHVGDMAGPIVSAAFFPEDELYLVGAPDGFARWHYTVPQRRLHAREAVSLDFDGQLPLLRPFDAGPAPKVRIEGRNGDGNRPGHWALHCPTRSDPERSVKLGEVRSQASPSYGVQALSRGYLVRLREEGADTLRLFVVQCASQSAAAGAPACVATLEWPADQSVRVREQHGSLLWYDAAGRVVAIDTVESAAHAVTVA